MAGIVGIVFIVLFQDVTVNNESEYYILKEAMEASMIESIDLTCYRNANAKIEDPNNECGNGKVKISEQKFVENFTRRFAESISGNVSDYKLEFYDIIETPPKATVVIKSRTEENGLFEESTFTIVNNLDGILETNKDYIDGINIKDIMDVDITLEPTNQIVVKPRDKNDEISEDELEPVVPQQ